MELKKNPEKNLELQKSLFLQIGLVISLLLVLVAFEWKEYDKVDNDVFTSVVVDIAMEEIEITRPEDKPPPPPSPQSPDIEIVDDDVEVKDELKFEEAEEYVEVEKYVERPSVEEEVIVEAEIFTIVEEQPGFPGGESKLMEYLGKNISYPAMARESNIQGTVFVTFVVEPDGSVSNVKILRGVGGGCDEEAVRVVRNMPSWKPGKQRGKPVRVQFNLPIKFVLQG